MDKMTIVSVAGMDGVEVEHVIIDRGNGEFTSMPKSVYDEQQAAQVEHLTEIIPSEAKIK